VVVVLGPSYGNSAELERVEWLTRTWPDLGLILVVEELSTTILQLALRAGVKDVLARPDRAQLMWAVERVADTLQVAIAPTLVPAPLLSDTPGKVTTVFSAKGGSGTSVIATNLAVTLARRSSGTVALIDVDLQFGDVAVMLKVNLEHSIADAAAAGARLDPQLLQSLMVRHDVSGLMVLPAPTEPALAEKIAADDVRRIIEVLRSFCQHIVIDTPAHFDDVVLALLDESDEIVLVSAMEVPGVKNLKLAVQTLRQLDMPVTKLKLVLVRSNTKVQMEVRDIERALALKASVVIPNDPVVPVSLNKCVPVVIDAPRSSVAKAFETLTDVFLPAVEIGKRSRHSMLSRRS
jgi:pilus assembly protein CpaE